MPRPRLTYANTMATVAVFVAIGGGAYAAGVAKDSVGTRQLKDDAVVSKKVEDGSLSRKDFDAAQLPVGATGPAGQAGATGPTGPTPEIFVTRRWFVTLTISADLTGTATASCDAGETLVGGGATVISGGADAEFVSSYPGIGGSLTAIGIPDQWRAQYRNADLNNDDAGNIEVRAYALCEELV